MLMRKQENSEKENKSPFFVKTKKSIKNRARLYAQKRWAAITNAHY